MDKIKLTIGVIITLAMLTSTYYIAQDDDAYYCEAKDMVMICEKLSAGIGTRCYFEDTYKVCAEGWIKLDTGAVLAPEVVTEVIYQEVLAQTAGKKWLCSPEGCTPI